MAGTPPQERIISTPPSPDRSDHSRMLDYGERIDFQLEVIRRMMDTDTLDDERISPWIAQHAQQFAAIVDAQTDDGRTLRLLIRTDHERALNAVVEKLREELH